MPVEQRQFKDIGTWMLEGKQAEVPEVLRGAFFMDGNDLAEDCLTFQGVPWNARKRRVTIPMLDHLQWTYEDSTRGRRLLFSARFVQNQQQVTFEDETLTKATVVPVFFGFLRVPRWLVEFTLIRDENDTNGDTWYRRNSLLFRSKPFGGYTLRRILDGDGQPTPAFADMLSRLPETCLVCATTSRD